MTNLVVLWKGGGRLEEKVLKGEIATEEVMIFEFSSVLLYNFLLFTILILNRVKD